MQLCDYGCGQEVKFVLKYGIKRCSKSHNQCIVNKQKNRERHLGKPRPDMLINNSMNNPTIKNEWLKIVKSNEFKQKCSRVGNENGNWRGGTSFEPYCEVFSQKSFKEMIMNRDKNVCQKCGITRMLSLKVYGFDLCVHHINYIKKDCDLLNLITLCNRCNSIANGNRDFWKEFYKKLIFERLSKVV